MLIPETRSIRNGIRLIASAVLVACVISWRPLSAVDLPDFSGTWTSTPADVQPRRFIDRTSGGWHRHVQGVQSIDDYRITITQTGEQVGIVFPRGDKNFLTIPSFPLSGEPRSFVQDLGSYWTKVVARGAWDGSRLTVTATRFAERWDVAAPSEVTTQPTEATSRHELTLSDAGQRLTIDTTLSDEKGLAEYRQVFHLAH